MECYNKTILILEPKWKEYNPLGDNEVVKTSLTLFQCELCGFMMNSLLEKVIHKMDCESLNQTKEVNVSISNKKSSRKKKVEYHRCAECNIDYDNKQKFVSHLKNKHTYEKNFICKLCTKAFKSSGHLKDHISRKHNDIRKYNCQQCLKEYIYESHLKIHLRRYHNKERTHICNICEKGRKTY